MKPHMSNMTTIERLDLSALRATTAAEEVERELGQLFVKEFTDRLVEESNAERAGGAQPVASLSREVLEGLQEITPPTFRDWRLAYEAFNRPKPPWL